MKYAAHALLGVGIVLLLYACFLISDGDAAVITGIVGGAAIALGVALEALDRGMWP